MIEWAVVVLFVIFCAIPAMIGHDGISYKDSLILELAVILTILTFVSVLIVVTISVMHVVFDTKSLYDTYLFIMES